MSPLLLQRLCLLNNQRMHANTQQLPKPQLSHITPWKSRSVSIPTNDKVENLSTYRNLNFCTSVTKLPHFYDWTKACETALAPSSPLLALQEEQSIAWAPIHSQSEAQALTLTLERIYSVGKPHASRSQNAPRFIKRTPQHGNQDPELHLISYGLISLKQKRKALHCLMKSIWKRQRSLQVQSLFWWDQP